MVKWVWHACCIFLFVLVAVQQGRIQAKSTGSRTGVVFQCSRLYRSYRIDCCLGLRVQWVPLVAVSGRWALRCFVFFVWLLLVPCSYTHTIPHHQLFIHHYSCTRRNAGCPGQAVLHSVPLTLSCIIPAAALLSYQITCMAQWR
jgi:hypothetical protein